MGDKEGSMEAEQVEENEMKAVLHCPPIYPLPEEIKNMESSEIVCLYCGVSYLIYHEFHQLRTHVAQLEAELQEMKEMAQREKAQREALELERVEWERAFHQAEVKEKKAREELEEINQDTARALRDEFEAKYYRKRREMEEEYHKISEEKERQLRGELGDLEAEKLRRQREELERKTEEREKVLNDALQKANKNLDELRKNVQQLGERLEIAAAMEEETEMVLEKEKQQGEILRGVCARQQQALRATLSVLHSSGSELTDVRGFLSQLTRAWQAFRCQILQHSTQVFSALSEELRHSSVELQKRREEKRHLTEQLMEQKRQREEQLSQHKDSEEEHRGKLLRLKMELEEKHERWLSCQQRCDALREQLSSWDHREEQMNRKYCAAVEEVTEARRTLEKIQEETKELKRERDFLIESHGRALTEMKEDHRQQLATELSAALEEQRSQSALQLREQMEELHREVELELTINREKNQLLLLQYQQDNSKLQHKLEEKVLEVQQLQEELQQERRSREEEIHQQEALQLSQAEKNAGLQEEVALLQETVRRECEEREELTAALSQAQQELFGLRSLTSHQGTSRPPPDPTERHAPPGNKNFHPSSQARLPLTRSSTSPNTLRPSSASTDKDKGWGTDGRGAGRSLESWNSSGVLGGEKKRDGALPQLKPGSTASEVKRKVSVAMGRKEKL
ncbi:protein LEKR1 [Acanthochromis polyacanthus]|uniref:protein LEKR1 n=1 Tax=Acanthochromis polyacanthus TaxID=80966 RepID=UPI0022341F11|nr:protein LEKR1 [Acanthochromis polyacanthus]